MGGDGTNQSKIETCGPFWFSKIIQVQIIENRLTKILEWLNILRKNAKRRRRAAGLKIQISDVNVSFEIKARARQD